MSSPRRIPDEQDTAACVSRAVPTGRRLSAIRPIVRRGLSRIEAASYLGSSPSEFGGLRKANRLAPAEVLEGRGRETRRFSRLAAGRKPDIQRRQEGIAMTQLSSPSMPSRLPQGCVED